MQEIDTGKLIAIRQFKKIIESLQKSESESVGLDIQRVEDLTVIDYKSRGYSKGARVRNARKAHFEKLEFKAAKQIAPLIVSLYGEIVKELEANEKPEESKLKAILNKLAPYGSWATLAYNILHNYSIL